MCREGGDFGIPQGWVGDGLRRIAGVREACETYCDKIKNNVTKDDKNGAKHALRPEKMGLHSK